MRLLRSPTAAALPLALLPALPGCGDPPPSGPVDADGDGFVAAEDCDDTNPDVAPDVPERCNGIDDDCDGEIDEEPVDGQTLYTDADGDGAGDPAGSVQACAATDGLSDNRSDCDDTNEAVYLGAPEVCDGVDNDCDNKTDDDDPDLDPSTQVTVFEDSDGDGHGDPAASRLACSLPAGHAATGGDCDDVRADVNPDATEICDDIDNDCDGLVDDDDDTVDATTGQTFYEDGDGDGWGDESLPVQACSDPGSGVVPDAGDCDDDDSARSPGEDDVCGDGIDNNCDSRIDETCPVSVDTADRILGGVGAGDLAAASVSLGGDLDGDGLADVAVGARRHDLENGDEGLVFVGYGALSVAGTGTLSDLAVQVEGSAEGDETGAWVHISPDLTGDGLDDLLVAARTSDAGALDGGAVSLLAGPLGTGTLALSAADATVVGTAERAYLGERGAQAGGDLNRDGVEDLVLTAWGWDDESLDEGAVFVFFGPVTADTDTAAADVAILGDDAFDQAGSGLAAGADLTGDGIDDLLVPAPGADRVGLFEGPLAADASLLLSDADRRFVGTLNDQFGASVCTADLNGDGSTDVVVGAPLHDSAGHRSSGAVFGFSGPFSSTQLASNADFVVVGDNDVLLVGTSAGAPAAGDLDGDGVDELVVPSLFADRADGATNTGALSVWADPLSGSVTTAEGWRTLEGAAANDNAGTGLSLGDLDGDGFDDLAIGSPAGDAGTTDGGTLYLFSGATL